MNAILDKIRKLLATAGDSGATPHEAAVALRLAQRLMLAHRVSEDDLADATKRAAVAAGDVRPEDFVTDVLGPRTDSLIDSWLAIAIANLCSLGVFRSDRVMKCYGLPADVAVGRQLYLWVRQDCSRTAREWCKPRGLSIASIGGKSFRRGYAETLKQRTDDERRARLTSSESVEVAPATAAFGALVVVEGALAVKHARALAAKRDSLGLREGRTVRYHEDAHATAAGRLAGRAVNLSRQVIQ